MGMESQTLGSSSTGARPSTRGLPCTPPSLQAYNTSLLNGWETLRM